MLSILLHVVIPFALSTAAFGQAIISADCANAVAAFSQNVECFGSPEAVDAFLLGSFLSDFSSAFRLLGNASFQEALATFYNTHCASQECVNLYVEAVQVCLKSISQQVNLVNIKAYTHACRYVQCRMICRQLM